MMRTRQTSSSPIHLALAMIVALTLLGCPGGMGGLDTGGDLNGDQEYNFFTAPDPLNQIHIIEMDGAEIVERQILEVPKEAFRNVEFEPAKDAEDRALEPERTKIHPYLLELLEEQGPEERVRLLVNFRDDLEIPRFPEPALDESRDSDYNRAARAEATRIIDEIQDRRAADYEKLRAFLANRFEAEIVDTYWLIKGMQVEAPLGVVMELAERQDVLYVEPENAGEKPPDNGNPADDVAAARGIMVSDPYFNLGQTNGYIGLLDTGMRFTHTLFNSPSNIDFRFDCTDGICNSNPDPTDDCWNHGTKTAAIITGNNNLGNRFRGVTGITLDSFKIYPAGCGGLSAGATVQAFQWAVAILDRVIVAEMQSGQDDTGSISTAADNAFDAGAVIIAANGNFGSTASTVNAPAIAHKVIGVGNFDVQSGAQIASQSRGPAPDGRYKPDIQAPTNTETASSANDTALASFGGTSGATPYASGAAGLLRNWLRGNSGSIDPGQVYAQLILSGDNPYPFNNTSGAGHLRLPTDGWGWWGKVSVADGATIDIPINVPRDPNLTLFDAALWWPETATQSHNDIDLHLVDPSGTVRDVSVSIPSVFERARADGTIQPGTWKVRIRGWRVPTGRQTVYWTAAAMRR